MIYVIIVIYLIIEILAAMCILWVSKQVGKTEQSRSGDRSYRSGALPLF